MSAELCRHELPKHLCDVCTPRQEPATVRTRARSGGAAPPLVENADTVIVAANVAYGEYLNYHAYVCQPDRPFRQDVRWMGFYAQEAIQEEVAEILYIRDRIPFTPEEVERLRSSSDETSRQTADLIERLTKNSTRRWGEDFKVFLLSAPNDPRTNRLPRKIINTLVDHRGSGTAFTQHQRYSRLDFLLAGPANTDELVNMGRVTPEMPSEASDDETHNPQPVDEVEGDLRAQNEPPADPSNP